MLYYNLMLTSTLTFICGLLRYLFIFQATTRQGLGATEMAVIMRNLMQRLGHKRYYLQGGDWGSAICSNIASYFSEVGYLNYYL